MNNELIPKKQVTATFVVLINELERVMFGR